MAHVMKYFGIPIAQFRKEWAELSDVDKKQLKDGVGELGDNGVPSGSLTY